MNRRLLHLTSGLFHDAPPSVCGLQQRALLCAQPGDAVLLSPRGLDANAVRDEHAWLARMDLSTSERDLYFLDHDRLRNVGSDLDLSPTAAEALLADQPVEVCTGVSFDGELSALAKRWSFRINGASEDTARRANSTAAFLENAGRDPELWFPRGRTVHRSKVPRAVQNLIDGSDDVFVVCVKPTDACMEVGHQFNICSEDDLSPLDVRFEHWVVQEQIASDAEGSVQFAMRNGAVTEMFLTRRLPDRQGNRMGDALWHEVPDRIETDVRNMAVRLLESFYGTMGNSRGRLDFCLCGRQVYLLGVHFEETGPFYAADVLRRICGQLVPFRLNAFAVPRYMPGETLTRHFTDMLYTPEQSYGFIPFCFLPQHGICWGLTFARYPVVLDTLFSHVRALQAELAC